MRNSNEQSVLQQVFNNGPISRIQVSKQLGLNKVTVSDIFRKFLEESYVIEIGQGVSTNSGGRKPIMVEINYKYGYTINLDFGYKYLDIMINYFNGMTFYKMSKVIDTLDGNKVLDEAIKLINELNRPQTVNGFMGIAVSIHGVIYDNKILYSPQVNYFNVDVESILSKEFGVPVMVENEANLTAIFERDFNSLSDKKNIISVSIHKGVGAGIILNGQLHIGTNGKAGEIGHSILINSPKDNPFSKFNTVEYYCSEDAIMEKINEKETINVIDYENTHVRKILDEFCYYLSIAIYNLIVGFDPDIIYINSKLMKSIPALLKKLKYNMVYLTNNETPIELSCNVESATLLGGCSLITHKVLNMEKMYLKFHNN